MRSDRPMRPARPRAGATAALFVLLAVTAACSGGDGGGGADDGDGGGRRGGEAREAPRPVEAGPVSAATEAWRAYDRPAEYEAVTTPVEVPVRDGTRLDCSLTRPARDGEPLPGRHPGLVVEFTPYQALRPAYEGEAAWFAERGYDGLACNLRGTGASAGTWQHAMSPQDGRDAHDLVEWLADQPHSDGRIGQFGESYGGQTSYGAAVEAPPHLRAVAPLQPPGNLYDDVVYPGGVKATEGGTIDFWPGIANSLSGGRIDAADEYATNRKHEGPEPVTAGEPTSFTIAVRAAHHHFAEGHRVALRVSGGAADTLTPAPEPVEVTIDPAASSLTFPRPVTAPA